MPLASDPGSCPPAFSVDLLRALGNSVTGGSLAGACQTIFGLLDLLISSSTPDIDNCAQDCSVEWGTWHDRLLQLYDYHPPQLLAWSAPVAISAAAMRNCKTTKKIFKLLPRNLCCISRSIRLGIAPPQAL